MSVNHQIDGGSGEVMGSGNGDGDREKNLQKKAIGYGRKAKRVVLSRIKRAKKRLQRNKRKDNRDSGGGCCLYIRRIPSCDSSSKSPTSDPNSSGFDFDSLRGLIEKSDFLLSECNTHLDVYSSDDDIDHDDDDDDDDDG